jgi:putative flavoprotein involved in K+ transport
MPFPLSGDSFPSKEQVADYLVEYATRFRLPIQHNVRINRLWKADGQFIMAAGKQRFESDNVVIAMANYQFPRLPPFAREIRTDIVQLHSHDYRNRFQLQDGGVLVVGVGNSGADIAIEVAQSHRTWLAGKESGHIPFPIESYISRHFVTRVVRFLGHHVLSVDTPIGRKQRPKMLHRAAPLIRVKPKDLINAGIERLPTVVGVKDGLPLLLDGRVRDVQNIIWCTGYRHDFPWVDLPIFDSSGDPIHKSGIVHSLAGIYFVGLNFLHSMTSATLTGVGRDAERVVNAIALRTQDSLSLAASETSRLLTSNSDQLLGSNSTLRFG